MPTNLPPECAEIEARYRAATSAEEKAACLEELLAAIPRHKGTDHLRAELRRRLARHKEESHAKHGGSRPASAFRIDREGAGQVAVIGCPNVGKSALVAALTNADPEVADYPFTTWTPTPGMIQVEDVQIQLIDLPPLHPDHLEPELIGLVRKADLLMVVVDLQGDAIGQLQETLAMLEQHHIVPQARREQVSEGVRYSFKPFLFVANKADDERLDGDFLALCELFEGECPFVPVAAANGRGFDDLKRAIFARLEVIRIYAKPPGKPPDMAAPFVIKRGATVGDLAAKVHRDFAEGLKSARVWGEGVYDGQPVGRDYELHDRDVVELRL